MFVGRVLTQFIESILLIHCMSVLLAIKSISILYEITNILFKENCRGDRVRTIRTENFYDMNSFICDTSRTNRQDYDCLFIETFRNELLILSISHQCNAITIFSKLFSHVYMLIIIWIRKTEKRRSWIEIIIGFSAKTIDAVQMRW